MAIVKKMT